jgi:hypothetical protein
VPRKTYTHSAYWKGKKSVKPFSFVRDFLENGDHRYRGNLKFSVRSYGDWAGVTYLGNSIAAFSVCLLADIGVAVRHEVMNIVDPVKRAELKRELMRDLRILRRPFYYAQETERRRALAMSRRKIKRRSTLSKMPTPELILEAWNRRKDSKEAMIRLGGIMQDLECYVDNCLKIDETGKVVGRNGGIRGWLKENLPDLFPKYKTLMRYKAMAIKLRQATGTKDPVPTQRLLRKPYHKVVDEILSSEKETFATVIDVLERHLSPQRVLDG